MNPNLNQSRLTPYVVVSQSERKNSSDVLYAGSLYECENFVSQQHIENDVHFYIKINY